MRSPAATTVISPPVGGAAPASLAHSMAITTTAASTATTNSQPPATTITKAPAISTREDANRCGRAGSNTSAGRCAIAALAPVVLAQRLAQMLVGEIRPAERR